MIEHKSVQQLIAEDLQCQCRHPDFQSEIKQRWLGMLVASRNSRNGIDGLIDDASWYDETKRDAVRSAEDHIKSNACRQLATQCNVEKLKIIVDDIVENGQI